MLRKARAWLELIRIGNALAIGFAAVVGYRVAGGHSLHEALILFLSAMMIGSFGNAINDYLDREIDLINKPWRPIPSGRISAREALIGSIAMLVLGLTLSSMLPLTCFVIACIAAVILFLYSWKLKKLGFLGNLTVATLSSLCIVYGGLAASAKTARYLLPAVYAFLVILGREILKGIEDVVGDRMHGVNTIAVKYGIRTATVVGFAILFSVVAISPLPYLLYDYNLLYLALAIIGVDIPVIIASLIMRKPTPERAWRATRLLKAPLICGLLAFYLGC